MAVIDFLNRQREQPEQQEVGIGGFTLLARTRETFTYTSQVPTAYLEDGSFANDHIILDPMTLTIEGSVSDIFLRTDPAVEAIREVQSAIGNAAAYLPAKTASQAQRVASLGVDVVDRARQIDSAVQDGQQVLGILGDKSPSKGLRERFIDSMESLHFGKQLIAIDMPFRRFDSMRITSISFSEDNKTHETNFSLTAQKVRFTDTIFVQLKPAPAPAPGLNGSTEGTTDKGSQEPEDKPTSLLSFGASLFGG